MRSVSRDASALAFTRGDRMRKALHYAGVSTEDMAEYLGVSPATLSRWLNMKGPANRAALRVWALRCGVRLDWLETGQGPALAGEGGPDDDGIASVQISGLVQAA